MTKWALFIETQGIIYKKLQAIYLMLYKRYKTVKIKNHARTCISLYIYSVISSQNKCLS